MHPRSSRRPLLPALLLALPLFSSPARADAPTRAESGARLDVDLDLGAPMDTLNSATLGAGGRFGWRFDLGPVWLQPEAGGSYTAFLRAGCDACQELRAKHPVRVFGGARIGGAGLVSGGIEPSIFGHVGYGWLSSTYKGPAFDVGFALDVRLVRHFRFGVHGAYNVVATQSDQEFVGPDGGTPAPAEKWISCGLHVGVAF